MALSKTWRLTSDAHRCPTSKPLGEQVQYWPQCTGAMAPGRGREAWYLKGAATFAAEGKKAMTGLHEGDVLPELPVLHDETDNPVQLMVVCLALCWSMYIKLVVLMWANVSWMFSSCRRAGGGEEQRNSDIFLS